MALYEFRLPDIGEGVADGEVVQWFVKEGEAVKEDAPLVSVLTDKANVEIPSPKSGVVVRLHAAVGEKVKVGATLVTIDTGGSPSAIPAASAAPATSMPASTAAPAPAAAARPGPGAPTEGQGRVLAAPYLRRRAGELGVDLSLVNGTGPGGRITETDLEKASAGPGPAPTAAPPPPPAAPSEPMGRIPAGPAVPPPAAGVERVPIRGIRRVIAEHMTEATHRAAHFTYVEEVEVTELVRVRDRMAKHVEKDGVRLTYLPFIIKGVIAGLRAHPTMNARMDDEAQELVVYADHHMGIATAGPEGLIVPVVHGADAKSVAQLAREIQDLSERGRAGKLTRAEMSGGTFTITSLGALGGVLATPILNYPEVAILGVHKISKRPVYRADGSVGPAEMMNLSLSLDHRILDGIIGAKFMAVVKSYLEDPHQLFAELA